jgi:glycosyltransferase involved in cell wall biosynthesis
MRIGVDATAIPARPAGAGNYILQLVRALIELEPESESHELVVFIQEHGMKLLSEFLSPDNQRSKFFKVEWVVLPDRHPGLRLAWEQTGLPWLVRKYRLDLLHSPHYTLPWLMPAPARRSKIPGRHLSAGRTLSAVTFHDMTFFLFPNLHTRVKRWFFPMAIHLSASRADLLIACSESTRQDAIRLLGIPPEKIHTVYEGISEDFRPIEEPEILETTRLRYQLPEKFYLYVGTVEPRKNLPLLIQSYARVRQDSDLSDTFPLVIVGQKGWHYEEVFQMVDQLQLKDSIHFTGYVPSGDIPILYNLASIFVYPSLYEGAGLPPLEALACGTPVITTAVSSMPEYVGNAALLVPPGNLDSLAQAMLQLSQDTARQEQLARLGPIQAAKFSWKRTAQDTLAIFQAALVNPNE